MLARLLRSGSFWTLLVVGVFLLLIYIFTEPIGRTARVDVTVPQFSDVALDGEAVFAEHCAECHGLNAAGSDRGPPLVHVVYRASHHADEAFLVAVIRGVPSHHWRYGNMPPQPDVAREDVPNIVQYVRELQAANGI